MEMNSNPVRQIAENMVDGDEPVRITHNDTEYAICIWDGIVRISRRNRQGYPVRVDIDSLV